MDQPLKYEQLIGEKLANLPIPDMEDMIWARVKAQLDVDLPADDSDEDDGDIPHAPAGPRTGWILPVLILGLVAAFFLFKNKKETISNTKQQPQITTPLPAPSGNATDPPPLPNNASRDDENSPATITPPAIISPFTDSVIQQDTNNVYISPALTDSNAGAPPAIVNRENPPATSDSIPPKKKQRGVRDITDDDYRIVPKNKKDSL